MKVRNTPVKVVPYTFEINKQGQKSLLSSQNTQFTQIVAGFNHSMALTKSGHFYTWGYNGYGLLGRKNQTTVPVQILTDMGIGWKTNLNYISEVQQHQNYQVQYYDDNVRNEGVISTEVVEVRCGNVNTYLLTNGGEVYAFGANRFGQLGRPEGGNHKK